MLSHIWFAFFLLAFMASLGQWLILGQVDIFSDVINATFSMAKLGAEIAIGLVGVLCLWLGFFKIAEQSGLIKRMAKLLAPLFRRLMPEVPEGHPAIGSVTMNLGANMLGLDNAATPLGLKAMRDLQSVNLNKQVASNAQILFLVLNTSSVTLLPVTVFLFRAQQGAAEPALVFIPILLATTASTIAGLLLTSMIQKLPIWDRVVMAYASGFSLLLAILIFALSQLPEAELAPFSSQLGNLILFSVMMLFLVHGYWRGINLYDAFIGGAKQGFGVAVRIIPYLIGMLVAIGVFRASGVLDGLIWLIEWLVTLLGMDTQFVQALPTALMKPLSGSGSRALMLETMSTFGVDSFPALTAATIQGSTETTFYVLAVYFGSVGIRKVRHAVVCGLLADLVGIVAAIFASYWFFG